MLLCKHVSCAGNFLYTIKYLNRISTSIQSCDNADGIIKFTQRIWAHNQDEGSLHDDYNQYLETRRDTTKVDV